jgi:lipopolysaccharide transport system ATP-binding protein
MSVVIKSEHLSKKYIISHQQQEKYVTLRDVVAKKAKSLFQLSNRRTDTDSSPVGKREQFWALRDINFDIEHGDRVGIIGRNGAGKSTLLKVLSRITEPTTGKISLKGRITSLLEVGTGFHAELTGRENIFLNGAILGMHRAEIKRKFDEIVDFSGVEKFLDTPVKRYSSGMYVRLAFAVAAHLESEILIVDEVLAVGDAEFQRKCLGKMQDVSQQEGRTVLFVSHNMQAITNLCSRVILINKGTVIQDDIPSKVIKDYVMFETSNVGSIFWDEGSAPGDSTIKLMAVKILDEKNNIQNQFFSKSKIRVQLDLDIAELHEDLVVGFDIADEDGVVILRTYHNDSKQEEWPSLQKGLNSIYCEIPGEFLNVGTYYISPKISLHCKKWILNADPLLSFDVELNHGVSPFWNVLNKSNRPGSLALIIPWKNKTEFFN